MKVILRIIQRSNIPLFRVLKYLSHTYALIALICFMMCPAVHYLGEETVDHIVIKGRTGIQSVLNKTDKKTTSLKLVLYSGSGLVSFVEENQKVFTYSSKAFNPSITFLKTTRLIL